MVRNWFLSDVVRDSGVMVVVRERSIEINEQNQVWDSVGGRGVGDVLLGAGLSQKEMGREQPVKKKSLFSRNPITRPAKRTGLIVLPLSFCT